MVAIKKMFLISFTINIIIGFLILGVAIIPGFNLIGVPIISFVWLGVNLIMLLVCLFKCKMPSMPGCKANFTDYQKYRQEHQKNNQLRGL